MKARIAKPLVIGMAIGCVAAATFPAPGTAATPIHLPGLPGVESDVNNLLQTTEKVVGSVTQGLVPDRSTVPVPAVPDLIAKPATGAAPNSPAPQPQREQVAESETPLLREGATAGQTKRSASRSRGQASGQAAGPFAGPKPSRRAARSSQRAPVADRAERKRAPKVRADSGDAVPPPVRAVALAAVLFDIDHFKWINDRYGHTTGDEVLAAVGAVARAEVRAGDFVGRYGGEEFLLVLPDTGERGAARVCEKVQRALRNIEVEGVEATITASFGVAAGTSATGNLTDLVQRADQTMYRAKANGRDRIELESSAERVPAAA